MASYIEFQKALFGMLAAVLPTLLWAGVAVWVAVKFRTEVARLVNSISGRIERGADVSALGMSLKDVKQVPMEQQKEQLDDAVRQEESSAPADPRAGGAPIAAPQQQPQAEPVGHEHANPLSDLVNDGIRREIYDAETLGLRFMNLMLRRPYTPNVRINGEMVDAAFVNGDVVEAVGEVKLIRNKAAAVRFIGQLRKLSERMSARSSLDRPIKVVGMAVLSNEITDVDFFSVISEYMENDPPFVLHARTLSWLRTQFGLGDKD